MLTSRGVAAKEGRVLARLRVVPEAVELRDAGSTNGTWVEGVQVRSVVALDRGTARAKSMRMFTDSAPLESVIPLAPGDNYVRFLATTQHEDCIRNTVLIRRRTDGS